MTTERWQQLKEIFHAALEREAAVRSAFLDEACAADPSLRREVEALIAGHEKEGSFIDSPAYEKASELLLDAESEMRVGRKLGSYEIISLLGRGGMGEVYLALDKRLQRRVALKVLPASFTKDAERLERFEREARAASALNHPNIITIHEIAEAGSLHFIATEFIEGETLREYLSHTRPGTVETLHIIIQIADALAAAHKSGIIHRDIKPENIMLRPDGYVKILDFGLAKLVEQQTGARASAAPTRRQFNTSPGMVMGTVSYMSPEQTRGDEVDARTDIWSLGIVFYEMLSGRVPFEGTTTSHIIVNILEKEPPWAVLSQADTPAELEWIVKKALRKDRDERYQTARDLLSDLRSLNQRLQFESELKRSTPKQDAPSNKAERDPLATGFSQEGAAETEQVRAACSTASFEHPSSPNSWNKRRAALMLVALLLIIGGTFGAYKFLARRLGSATEAKPNQTAVSLLKSTSQVTFSPGIDNFPSFSPSGDTIVYSSDQTGTYEIYLKQLAPGGREIQLTSDGQQNIEPALSPDGQRIAYYSKNRGGIWIVPALGGTPRQLVEFGSWPAWSHDGSMIAFQSLALLELGGHGKNALPPSTIWAIPAQGGAAAAKQITQVGKPQGGHGAPSWSPDGKRIVFDASDFASTSIWSVAVETGDLKEIAAEGSDAVYAPDGENIYYSRGGLWKARISPATGERLGEPVLVVGAASTNFRFPTISADGKRIAYSALTISSNLWSLPLASASKQAAGPPAPFSREKSYRENLPRFSPDGKKIAFNRWRAGTSADIWVVDADGRNPTQVTTNPASELQAGWFPEGDKIAFLSNRDNDHMILWSATLASGKEESLLDLGEGVAFGQLSPDGKQVVFHSSKSGTINIWVASLTGGAPQQLTFDNELMGFPCWSPDGKLITFEVKRGDDSHVAIIPSGGGTPTQLTFEHGQSWGHSWSPDGERIVFAGLRNDYWNLYWVSRDGRTQKQLTNYSKSNAFVRYPTWSPLGNQIVYEYAEITANIWVIDLK